MGDGIGSVAAIGEEGLTLQLSDLTSETSLNADVQQTMSTVLDKAIEHASTLPGQNAERIGPRNEMTNSFAGEFGEQKEEYLSDVELSGVDSTPPPDVSEIEQVSEALSGLIHDLSTWHVTWGVAQTAQKDLSHILKSS